ncbi:MAG: hypothetical protein ACYCW6_00805 [Candidatus Xenobia bacterium]
MGLLVLLAASLGGTVLSTWYDAESGILARMAMGSATGLVGLALVGFLLACPFKDPNGFVIFLSVVVMLTPCLLLRQTAYRDRLAASLDGLRLESQQLVVGMSCGLLMFVLLLMLPRVMYFKMDDPGAPAPAVYTGFSNNLGDLPFHLAITTSFAWGHNFLPQDPEYAGVRLTYPYLADFLTAMVVRCGARIDEAIFLTNAFMVLSLVGLLYWAFARITGERFAGALAPWLALFNGGLGFAALWTEAGFFHKGIPLWKSIWLLFALMPHLPHDYTIFDNWMIRWGNALTTLLMPERSLLMGIPPLLVVLGLWWRSVVEPKEKHPRQAAMLAAGIITGLLPLAHTYCFLILFGIGIIEFFIFRSEDWKWFFIPALLLALPQAFLLKSGSAMNVSTFFGPYIGWDHGGPHWGDGVNPITFWIVNTGVFFPLLTYSCWLLWEHHRKLLLFYLPFTLLFLVGNVMRLAPWVWDNVKILYPWFLLSIGPVSWGMVHLCHPRSARESLDSLRMSDLRSSREAAPEASPLPQAEPRPGEELLRRLGVVALFVLLTLSGSLDVIRALSPSWEFRLYSGDMVALARAIIQRTPTDAVILHAPGYDSPTYLTGRLSLLGYEGHLWTRGIDYRQRDADVRSIYEGTPQAVDLLRDYHVGALEVGPEEMRQYHINTAWFDQLKVLAENKGVTIYAVQDQK